MEAKIDYQFLASQISGELRKAQQRQEKLDQNEITLGVTGLSEAALSTIEHIKTKTKTVADMQAVLRAVLACTDPGLVKLS